MTVFQTVVGVSITPSRTKFFYLTKINKSITSEIGSSFLLPRERTNVRVIIGDKRHAESGHRDDCRRDTRRYRLGHGVHTVAVATPVKARHMKTRLLVYALAFAVIAVAIALAELWLFWEGG